MISAEKSIFQPDRNAAEKPRIRDSRNSSNVDSVSSGCTESVNGVAGALVPASTRPERLVANRPLIFSET